MSAPGRHTTDLSERAQAAFHHWGDEQDRSDWFEDEARRLARIADELEQRVKALEAERDSII